MLATLPTDIQPVADHLRTFGPKWTDRFLDAFWGPSEARDRKGSRFHVMGTQRQREREGRDIVRRFAERGALSPGALAFLQQNPAVANVPGFALVPENILGTPDFQQYAIGGQAIEEIIRWPLWHITDYTAAGSTVYRFFNQDQGAATYGANGTNMLQANSLPASEYQIVTHVEYMIMQAIGDFQVASATAVVAPGELQRALYSPNHAEMFVGKKIYLNVGPLGLLPTGTGISGGAFGGGAGAGLTTPVYNTGDKWKLAPPLGIKPLWIFGFNANWNAVRTITTACFQVAILDGYQARAVH